MSSDNRRPWLVQEVQGGQEKKTVVLTTPFSIEASVIAVDHNNARSLRIKFQDEELQIKTIDIETGASVVGKGREILSTLRNQGVLFTEDGADFIVDVIRETQPPNAIRQYERAGFRGTMYLTPAGEAINTSSKVELVESKRQKGISKRGNLDEWKTAVKAAFAHYHFRVGVSLGFVGVLIDLLQWDTNVVFFTGESSHGKSTSQRLAASAWGDTTIAMGQWVSAQQTKNALEVCFEQASGSYLALEEANHMTGKDIKDAVYLAYSGSGKGRLNQHAEAKNVRGWRTIVTISDELSLVQKLRAEGASVSGGLTVRSMDVNFDDMPLLAREQMDEIEKAYANTGHAGPLFVQQLVAMGYVDNPEKLKAEINQIVKEICGPGATSQQRRAAIIPALTAKAGIICQTGKERLFPADADMMELGREMWRRAKESDLAPSTNGERALAALRENIIARKKVDIVDVADDPHRVAKGWFIKDFEGNEDAYAILVSASTELAGGILTPTKLGKILKDEGMLFPHSGKGNARDYVPKVGPVRCFVIRASAIEDEVKTPKG